jgi:hypothetical protein
LVGSFNERELELADLELVAVVEPLLLDALTVDIRAVEAVQVFHPEAALVAEDPRVMARDRDIVEKKVALRAAADRKDVDTEVDGLPLSPAAGTD